MSKSSSIEKIEKKVTRGRKTPEFQEVLEKKFRTWTGLEDPEISEALKDLCGDSYFEIRRMTAQLCRAIEASGIEPQKIKDLVQETKILIDDAWRSTIDKQKVGVDKLGIVIRKHLKDE